MGFTDGTGAAAQFDIPSSLAIAPDGTLYVVDWANHAIRAVTPSGAVTTFAGGTQGAADGVGTAAQFDRPLFIAVATNGTIYLADHHNHLIRAITPAGVVTTLAGGSVGAADGVGRRQLSSTTPPAWPSHPTAPSTWPTPPTTSSGPSHPLGWSPPSPGALRASPTARAPQRSSPTRTAWRSHPTESSMWPTTATT